MGLPRILIIEDDDALGRLAQRNLRRSFEVVWDRAPRAALARLEAGERFDAVLCDHLMPELSGLEVYAILAERWPALAARFFLTSGLDAERLALPPAFLGRFLAKPYNMAAMRCAIEAAVGVTAPGGA